MESVSKEKEDEKYVRKRIHHDRKNLTYDLITNFYKPKQRTKIIKLLEKLDYIPLEESQVCVFNKWYNTPRRQLAIGDPGLTYGFSGANIVTVSWKTYPFLQRIRDDVWKILVHVGILPPDAPKMNYVFVNKYRNGHDYIGTHADDEKDMFDVNGERFIISLSFGATRDFIFSLKSNKRVKKVIPLACGYLLVMRGKTNDFWKHALPKRLRVKKNRVGTLHSDL